jgi:hypothetical protein
MILRNMGRMDLALSDLISVTILRPDWLRPATYAANTALELGENEVARKIIDRCKILDSTRNDFYIGEEDAEPEKAAPRHQKAARFPVAVSEMVDFRSAISKHLLDPLAFPRVLTPSSKIFAAGSCFAANIAKVLNDQGHSAFANNFGESINSTLANREYFDWLCASEAFESEISELIPADIRDVTRAQFFASDLIILTVGVAPVFLDRVTGKLRLQTDEGLSVRRLVRECEFRTLSVGENVENLSHILATIRRHRPEASIFITLSPVPLSASFEYESAIMADCVSKSVLRVAIDEIFRQQPQGVYYWPAFEAVHWIGGYAGGAYGEDDGATRHVSVRVVDAITSEFISRIQVAS